MQGSGACVCPYYGKECFCHSKKSTGLFCHLFLFHPLSILTHTFEPLSGIVPWCWLGSLLPRPLQPSWPAGLSPPTTSTYPSPPTITHCQRGHGSGTRASECSKARLAGLMFPQYGIGELSSPRGPMSPKCQEHFCFCKLCKIYISAQELYTYCFLTPFHKVI